jgi:FAD/FMN-containing dehydrogenase
LNQTSTNPIEQALPAAVRRLAGQLDGELVLPNHESYDQLRRVANGFYRRTPPAIAMCASTADVVASVKAAREAGWPIAVRTSGHHSAGFGSLDDGLIIDLSRFSGVTLDLERRLATVRPGTLNSNLDRATYPHGLMCPTGTCEDVAVGGAHLMGGWSFLSTTHGFGCDSIVELEVVTATGEVLIANERENPDLFWAMRGAGWNFGISTKAVYTMHPVPRKVLGGELFYDVEDAVHLAETLRRLQAYWDGAPDEAVFEITIVPSRFNLYERGRAGLFEVRLEVVYIGDYFTGAEVLAPLFELAPVRHDDVRPIDFPHINLLEGTEIGIERSNGAMHWNTQHIPGFSQPVIDILVEQAGVLREINLEERAKLGDQTNFTGVGDNLYFYPYKGEMCRIPEDFNAYGVRDPGWICQTSVFWDPDEQSRTEMERRITWSDAVHDALVPYSNSSAYLNSAIFRGENQVRGFYGDAKYRKLQRLKAKYDPENFFNRNFNIPPDPNA